MQLPPVAQGEGEDRQRVRPAEGAIVAHVGPDPTRIGLAFGQLWHGGLLRRSLPLGYQVEYLLSVAGRQRSTFHGLMTSSPAASNAVKSRVAIAKVREAAIAAI